MTFAATETSRGSSGSVFKSDGLGVGVSVFGWGPASKSSNRIPSNLHS